MRKLFRTLWPAKTSLEFAARTGVCERTAHRVLAGEREMSARALIDLLWTDDGQAILDEAMRGCDRQWWRELQRVRDLGRAGRKADEALREVARLSRGFGGE